MAPGFLLALTSRALSSLAVTSRAQPAPVPLPEYTARRLPDRLQASRRQGRTVRQPNPSAAARLPERMALPERPGHPGPERQASRRSREWGTA